jgi:hypothetical protein
MKGNIWPVVVVALALAVAGPLVLDGGFHNAADYRNATETTTPDFDTNYSVDAEPDDVYQYNESINVTQNATVLEPADDYRWNTTRGAVSWLNNSTRVSTNETATIRYNYTVHSDRTNTVAQVIRVNAPWIGLLLLITALGALKVLALDSW